MIAPAMFVLFFCHWYDSGAVPVAAMVNVAVPPIGTVRFAGCWVICGALLAVLVILYTLAASRAR